MVWGGQWVASATEPQTMRGDELGPSSGSALKVGSVPDFSVPQFTFGPGRES